MGEPVRILHAVVNMNRGGAETLIMNLYRHMDRSRFQFDFLTCKDGVFDREIREMGGIVHQIPYVTDVGHFGYLRALDHFFGVYSRYRVVHAHMDKMSGLVLSAAKRAGIPIRIAHSHSTGSEGGAVSKMYKWMAGKGIMPNATNLLACSEGAAAWLYRDMAKASHILKNGIDCKAFSFSSEVREQAREELGLQPAELVAGHIGRFNEPKNHGFLLDIFHELQRLRPDAKLVFVGDGPKRKEMEQKAEALNVSDRVLFLGVRSDVSRLLQAMDVMAFPSLHEGLPIALIEAQGTGLPCVVSDRITPEVDLGLGLMQFAALEQSPAAWAQNMISLANRPRERSEAIQLKDYNIRDSSFWLQRYYEMLLKGVAT